MSSGTDMMISTTLASVCLSMRRIGVCGVVVFYRERRGIGAIGTLHRDAPKPHPIRLLLHGQSQTAERVKLAQNVRRIRPLSPLSPLSPILICVHRNTSSITRTLTACGVALTNRASACF